ncbi:MAG: hypothetical protein ACKVX7_05240, partial [Planctomycetota bacterium]
MQERVYDGSELTASCWLRAGTGSEAQRVGIQKISPSGAILSAANLPAELDGVSVEIEFADGDRCQLAAQVLRSGSSGLFLAWLHTSTESVQRLEQLLRPTSATISTPIPPAAVPPSEGRVAGSVFAASAADSGGRSGLVQIDGKTDLYATLRQRARSIRSSDIAARHNTVRVIDLTTIAELVNSAVEQTVDGMQRTWTEEEKARLRLEAEQLVKSQLAGLSAEKSTLARQLEEARAQLAVEQARIVAPERFTVSESGLIQLEDRMGRLLDRCLAKGQATPELESDLRTLLSQLLDSERERIADQARNAQSDRVQLLERKIERLSRNLQTTRSERDRARALAHELELAGGGLRNIYQPGLRDD